jgi:sialic acid synthase SpsE
MHCVAIYPTPDQNMNLNQIAMLRSRYPGIHIGWSTHESPSDTVPVQLAVALGAELFERHVGIATKEAPLNAYSSTPDQVAQWIETKQKAQLLCGPKKRQPASDAEQNAIDGLKRGVFAKTKSAKEPSSRVTRFTLRFPIMKGSLIAVTSRQGSPV